MHFSSKLTSDWTLRTWPTSAPLSNQMTAAVNCTVTKKNVLALWNSCGTPGKAVDGARCVCEEVVQRHQWQEFKFHGHWALLTFHFRLFAFTHFNHVGQRGVRSPSSRHRTSVARRTISTSEQPTHFATVTTTFVCPSCPERQGSPQLDTCSPPQAQTSFAQNGSSVAHLVNHPHAPCRLHTSHPILVSSFPRQTT
jgi:hypothetical protein